MIIFNIKDVIEAYKDIGSPLSDDCISEMEIIVQELRDLRLSEDLVVMDANCRVCGHEQTSIAPAIADLDNLECGHCGNMTSQEVDENEWWQE